LAVVVAVQQVRETEVAAGQTLFLVAPLLLVGEVEVQKVPHRVHQAVRVVALDRTPEQTQEGPEIPHLSTHRKGTTVA
jgi:hypothetical protein